MIGLTFKESEYVRCTGAADRLVCTREGCREAMTVVRVQPVHWQGYWGNHFLHHAIHLYLFENW